MIKINVVAAFCSVWTLNNNPAISHDPLMTLSRWRVNMWKTNRSNCIKSPSFLSSWQPLAYPVFPFHLFSSSIIKITKSFYFYDIRCICCSTILKHKPSEHSPSSQIFVPQRLVSRSREAIYSCGVAVRSYSNLYTRSGLWPRRVAATFVTCCSDMSPSVCRNNCLKWIQFKHDAFSTQSYAKFNAFEAKT